MKKRNIENYWKVVVAIAVALAFVMPGAAAFANVGAIGVTSNSENTGDMEDMVEISTNSDTSDNTENTVLVVTDKDNSDGSDIENIIDFTTNDKRYTLEHIDSAMVVEETTTVAMPITGKTIYVDDDRPPEWYNETQVKTIQEGVDNATAGDTVYVYNGTYYEHVTVNKQLDLVGESRDNVIVDGGGVDNVFYVTADYASISKFTVTNGRIGIYIEQSSNNNFSDIVCYNHFWVGFNIYQATYGNYLNCEVYDCSDQGIRLWYQVNYNNFINCNSYNNGHQSIFSFQSSYNNFINCNSYGNSGDGIFLDRSPDNNLTNCKSYQNTGWGLNLASAFNNILRNNQIYDNKYAITATGHQDIDTSNTVNGKIIYYLVEETNMTLDETDNVGYLGLVSCDNITLENSDVYGCYLSDTSNSSLVNIDSHDSLRGIFLERSSNINVSGCDTYNNSNAGIYLDSSPNCNIENCNSYNNSYGIYLINSPDNNISSHFYSNLNDGIYVQTSSNNDFTNCLSNNNSKNGIYIYNSQNSDIIDCAFRNNVGHGMYIYYLSSYTHVTNCDSYNNEGYGAYLYYNSDNVFENCKYYGNTYGFVAYRSANNYLQYNTINDNDYNFAIRGTSTNDFHQDINPSNYINGKPIWYVIEQNDMVFDDTHNFGYLALISCTNITAKNSDTNGIMLVETTDSTISDVSSHKAMYGIYLYRSSKNNITNCNSYDNNYGLYFYYSPDNTVRDSSLHSNDVNLEIYGGINDFHIDIDTSNTVNGKTIYYLIEETNMTLDETDNVGYLGLVSCDNITLKNSDIWGVVLIDTSHSTLLNVNSHNTRYGIYSFSSGNNDFINCNSYDNSYYGIYLISSLNSNIENCNSYDNNNNGIYLESSSDINVTNCNSYNNSQSGIHLKSSPNNNIINCNAYDDNDGFYIDGSSYNNIINCSSYNNSRMGLFLRYSSNNNIVNCKIHDNPSDGIYIGYPADSNRFINCASYNNNNGVYLVDSTDNQFIDSSFYNNSVDGMLLSHSYSSIITNCLFYDNTEHGIYIQMASTGNEFTDSSFYNNNFGVYFSGTSGNLIHHNNFVGNIRNAYGSSGTTNTWDDGAEGSFWGDYTGVDGDGDGIGDTPYDIPGCVNNQDRYPLMTPVLSVQLLSPEDGSSIKNLMPTFDWTDVEPLYPVTYTLQVATDPSFEESTLVINETELEESEYTPSEHMVEGVYYWRVSATVGIYVTNWSETWCFTIELEDSTPPTTTHEFYGTLGDNGWYVSDVSIEITAEDDWSGVKFTYYKIDDDDWQEYTGEPILVTEDGIHNLRYYSVDYVGNEETVKGPFGFKIDQTVPTITLTAEKTGFKVYNLIADVSDETSGVAKVEFYVNGELVGTVTTAPYEYEVSDCSQGDTATATVYDNAGLSATSEEVTPQSHSQSQSSSNLVPVQRKISLISLGGLTGIQNTQRRV